ncbi:MAG: F0F1 ATP synthase subunit epsilon [Desulfobulbaceae bacterium]|jgi:F-type H+-transporting ATPase subunit epsilon|nr:F0F1 ATP synthase subunit epsilon [Desulfobulbaceae bacterium]
MAQIELEIVTPSGPVVSESVDIVTAPGFGGVFGVLANHAPFLSTIKVGELAYKQDKSETVLMVSGGFCEVSNNKITFIVESCEKGTDIDVDRALKAKERAEKRLAAIKAKGEKHNMVRAEAALQRALARVVVSKKSH